MQPPKSVKDLARKTQQDITFDVPVSGHNFESDMDLQEFIKYFSNTGFQATNIGLAIKEIEKMKNSKIFFGCTSNIISSGLRDIIKYLIKNKFIHVFCTTGGGIEEDIIKTFNPTFLASFNIKGSHLRDSGYNRIGNLVIPNENYEIFEKWLVSLVDEITEGYSPENPLILTPSKLIKIFGEKINHQDSILYWASKNGINIYCPGITDGSIGDILTFHPKRECLKLDVIEDIYNLNREAFFQKSTGAIILGCGIIKHQILNANLFRNGLDFCVLVNTAEEYNGSDAGASIEEAISWGKVVPDNTAVKIFGDATIIFPILVAGSFYKQNK
ncbi:deoxyhypusine synthase [Hamiltosporidium tvaerminnensis]|uniref:deoxyhypusine synthase n=2 Tax=Hamiltosporidium TaxID=1176354 RepID=A0A4Q9L8D1_9MICR|nr:deoxyhypusine synthase [Hamiltosporidium tvaerminnensis]TBU08006.1 deoxyhypusine synthase [Hamiltosporidium magnivora]TBU11318.1 deoxyhypusine synthase [Hamiltosporidium tvaerminnensis]